MDSSLTLLRKVPVKVLTLTPIVFSDRKNESGLLWVNTHVANEENVYL